MRGLTATLIAATIAAGLGACGGATSVDIGAGTGRAGSATTTATTSVAIPMTAISENQLRAEWTSQVTGNRARLTGAVYNGWVMWARDIVLLVDSLDPAGQIVQRSQARLWRRVGPGSSSYFDLTVPAAASYRIQVVGVRWLTDEELRF